jgi:hypothetical protein
MPDPDRLAAADFGSFLLEDDMGNPKKSKHELIRETASDAY